MPDRLQDDVEPLTGECVQRTEWLVQEQDAGIQGEGPGNRRALARPTGELVRPQSTDVGGPHQPQQIACAPITLRPRPSGQLQRERDVLERRAPR